MVTIKTRKKTYRVDREEFIDIMRILYEHAQARKAVRADLQAEKNSNK